ncbi:MAG: hypothetical protein IOD12_00080 [Silvanigrellales bacterium]|nr:hypothetical protein [Silvanigrellales bacterium]
MKVNKKAIAIAALLVVALGCVKKKSKVASAVSSNRSAFQRQSEIARARVLGLAEPLRTEDGKIVRFGAEKEGSTRRIFNIATFNLNALVSVFKPTSSASAAEKKALFDVLRDPNAQKSVEEASVWTSVWEMVQERAASNFDASSDSYDDEKFSNYNAVEKFARVSLDDVLTPSALLKAEVILKGIYAQADGPSYGAPFFNLVPRAEARKYIESIGTEAAGKIWEIRLRPTDSLKEFEDSVSWYRSQIASQRKGEDPELYDGPGHVWISTPNSAESVSHYVNLLRLFIYLRGVSQSTGIMNSKYNSMLGSSGNFKSESIRAPVRFTSNKFYSDGEMLSGWEIRSGMKSEWHRGQILDLMLPRLVVGDFLRAPEKQGQFEQMDQFFQPSDVLKGVNLEAGCWSQILTYDPASQNPASWSWGPRLRSPYREFVERTQVEYAQRCKAINNPEETEKLTKAWVRATGVASQVEAWLQPTPPTTTEADFRFSPPGDRQGSFDANTVDLGLELTSRFPLSTASEFADDELEEETGKKEWLQTVFGMSDAERTEFLRDMAGKLSSALGGSAASVADLSNPDETGHGHGIVKAFSFLDASRRKWRVEWDGVGRSYDDSGKIVPDSPRGGHIEVVTPKFQPTAQELESVYRVFSEMSSIPSSDFGGGHINIDLAPFECNPKALARFISFFHEYRDVMTVLFQSPKRMKSAEPLWANGEPKGNDLVALLSRFNGNSSDLAKILYDSRYFNTRVGRKTKYTQLNVTAFFQDVVPARFVTSDFDIMNPTVPWRQTFEFDPRIRKMEFRLFDAPKHSFELASQIRFVRALLDLAVRGTESPKGLNARVDQVEMARNPSALAQRYDEFLKLLRLNTADYDWLFWPRLSKLRAFVNSDAFSPLAEKLAANPQREGWGPSLSTPRTQANGLVSAMRSFERYGKSDTVAEISNPRLQQIRNAASAREGLSCPLAP